MRKGQTCEFYCTMQGADENGLLIRNYTGQTVTVVRHKRPPEVDSEIKDVYLVRASDGVEFDAFECELDGQIKNHGPYYDASGGLFYGEVSA